MRILKLILISIVVFGGLIMAFSLLFPPSVRISRAINIGVSKEKVQHDLSNLAKWRYWNKMTNNEELTNEKFSDSSFSSDQMKISLVSASQNSVITRWNRHQNESINSGFNLISSADSTIVQWYFDFQLNWYPWEKFGSIIFDKQLGPPMESSLSNFKKFMENRE